jgi:hypothetical protein
LITFSSSGSWKRTESFLQRMARNDIFRTLDKYGQMGVQALAAATPRDSGATAASWTYEIKRGFGSYTITWGNTNMAGGSPVAILLQYGHGTGTGGYVQGRDYINPAILPIFDKIADEAWKAVTKA